MSTSEFPEIVSLSCLRIGSGKAHWLVEVKSYGSLGVSTRVLMNNRRFNCACMEKLGVAFDRMREADWFSELRKATTRGAQ